jgi:hypothetical protein
MRPNGKQPPGARAAKGGEWPEGKLRIDVDAHLGPNPVRMDLAEPRSRRAELTVHLKGAHLVVARSGWQSPSTWTAGEELIVERGHPTRAADKMRLGLRLTASGHFTICPKRPARWPEFNYYED